MNISGRTVAYLVILLVVFLVGGITFAGAQGFPPNPLPVPVEDSGIVEVYRTRDLRFYDGVDCNFGDITVYPIDVVPAGKRLVVEFVTAHVTSLDNSRVRGDAKIVLVIDGSVNYDQTLVVSRGFPTSFVGPVTAYVNPGETFAFEIVCPSDIRLTDDFLFDATITGRFVPYPHPSTIPTATPPPG